MAGYFSQFNPAYDSYGTLELTADSTQFITEPISLSEARQFLRVDFDDDDSLIMSLITAAREQAELLQRRVLVRKQFDLTYDYWPGYRVELASPVVSVDLVEYTDSDGNVHELVSGTDYVADLRKQPAVINTPLNTTWPWFNPAPSSSILIRFTAGYAADDAYWSNGGARVRIGMLLLLSHWYSNRVPVATGVVTELPFAITMNLSAGSLRRPR